MKYLKKSSDVFVGNTGIQDETNPHLSDYTAVLAATVCCNNTNSEELLGIFADQEHLKQIRNKIDDYLEKTSKNVQAINSQKNNQMQLVIDSKLVLTTQYKPSGSPNSWSAKLFILSGLKDFDTDGKIELSAFGASEEHARIRLNIAFYNLIMACVNPDLPESRIPDIVHELNESVNVSTKTEVRPLKFNLNEITSKRTNEGWEARIVYWKGCNIELTAFGNSEAEAKAELYKELIIRLQNQLSVDNLSVTNKTKSGEQVNKCGDKDSTPFKLNPSRVMSMKIGGDKWEARTRLFNGIDDRLVDLSATADSEQAAREELDKKFESFAKPMTNFIKFMSQAF